MSIPLVFPVIDCGDFILRNIMPLSDAKDYFDYMSNRNVFEFVSTNSACKSLQHAQSELKIWGGLFNTRTSIYWAIALKSDDKMIGSIGFNYISDAHSRGELSYDLSHQHWGKGIMTRAIKAVIDFSRTELKLIRLQATAAQINKRSRAVLERCKFKAEGLLQKYEYLHGKYVDHVMYALML